MPVVPAPVRSRLALLAMTLPLSLNALAAPPSPHRLDPVEVAAPSDDGAAPVTTTSDRLGLEPRERPATVDVIRRQDIEQQGLRNLIELYRSAPGVSAGNIPGSPASVSMRGFNDVGYLFDGIRAVDPSMVSRNLDTWNLQRVEILKGPASVIHGSGALAGTINLVPRQPDLGGDHYDGMISYGSNDTLRLGIGTNQVVSPRVAVRTDLSHSESNGYVDGTDSRVDALTSSILIQASDRLLLSAAIDLYSDSYRTPYQGAPLLPATLARDPSSVVSGPDGLVLDESIRDNNYNVDNGSMAADSQWLRTRADYQLSQRWRLINELGLYNANRDWANSEDYTYNETSGLLDRSTTRINHHHRFASERVYASYDGDLGDHRHRFSAGMDYQYTDFDTRRRFGNTGSVDPFNPDRGQLPANNAANYDTRVNYDSTVATRALFLEDAFNLTARWLLITGARYEFMDLDRGIDDLDSGSRTEFGRTFEDVSWRVGTVFDLTNRSQLFAQYNRAAAPISGLLLGNIGNADFDLSKGRSVEAGIRSQLWEDRITLTTSAFRIDQDDILTRDVNDPTLTVQGGSQRSRGIEATLAVALTPRWWVNFNGTLVDAEYTRLVNGSGDDLSGNRPSNVAEKTYNLSSAYTLASLPLTLGGAVRHTGDFYTDSTNRYRVRGRTLLDTWLSYPLAGGTLTLRGRNLTDKFYADWSGYSATQVYVGEPRTVELGWTGHF